MISEHASTMAAEANVVAKNLAGGPLVNKKEHRKIPKKIHKAEREKLKRDHLNELFLELGLALEPSRQNNGKACILGDATRLLRDLIAQVESLQRENATLVSESRYVTVEKNELKDENTVLEAEIQRLHNELHERMHSDPVWHNNIEPTPVLPQSTSAAALPLQQQQQPVVGPVFVLPLHHHHQELQTFQDIETAPKPSSHVKKPQARYPTASDSWPLELLAGHQRSASCSSGDDGSDRP